jgi:hypothetical protein
VREEFERYLRCGILAHGFARVHCGAGHAGPWLGTRAESVAPSMRRSRPSSRSSGVAPVGRASGAPTVALFRSFRDLATL